jgi:cellulose synthase/poly-beta-1,6-N-acetylglucosamine synthase-like glycosyltransferase
MRKKTVNVGRPRAGGKFLFLNDEKLYVRGVTYGTFRPLEDGHEYPVPAVVDADFAAMAENGITAVRTYTVPPRWLLNAAGRRGLRLMVGIPVERWIGYLIDRKGAPDIGRWLREKVRSCAGHPAILCYTIGNEIPAPVVRWHGRLRMERFIERLYGMAKEEDPEGLVTYVNYPSTEYLHLPFLDLVCFNVYLERQRSLESYLARLQNLAGDRPLILTEVGLDSLRHGEEAQSSTLESQLRAAFRAGCGGAFVYSWTDEWHAGGTDMQDWAFGLTRRDRRPKPALDSVRRAFTEIPVPTNGSMPLISVVVCSYNGAQRIRDCLEGISRLEYPRFEVIMVDDGSTDNTSEIARQFPVRLIRTEQRGLSHARNTGLRAAAGDIVAYIDDDARPDPHWLTDLASSFAGTNHAGVGGPNIAPISASFTSECFARAPGCPVQVLLSDEEAEHIPGCNMAFRRECLEAIGGFDQRFRVAGDDVDLCWRLQARGWTLGFHPGAMVWHDPRRSLRSYWRQQSGYGKAEALLETKWPEKYDSRGHLTWAGRIYAKTPTPFLALYRARVYHGIWGSAPFQRLYMSPENGFTSFPLTPDWYYLWIGLAPLSALGFFWKPLFYILPFLILALGLSLSQAILAASRSFHRGAPCPPLARLRRGALMALLFFLQPLARLHGRFFCELASRWRSWWSVLPLPETTSVWTERWQVASGRLEALRALLSLGDSAVLPGGEFDRWDLEVRGGRLGATRLLMAVEEHGQGRQLVRLRSWPRFSRRGLVLLAMGLSLAGMAAADGAWVAAVLLASGALWVALQGFHECAASSSLLRRAVRKYASVASNDSGWVEKESLV